MRITPAMITTSYKNNLNGALSLFDYYNQRATTYRKYEKVSEDPVSAAKQFAFEKEYCENENYQANLSTADGILTTAEGAMVNINSVVSETLNADCLMAITGTSSVDERNIIAEKLEKVQDSILSMLNTKMADQYVFGGNSSTSCPFTVSESGRLLYHGVDVDTGELVNEDGSIAFLNEMKMSFGKDNETELNGYTIETTTSGLGAVGDATIDAANKKIVINIDETSTKQNVLNSLKSIPSGNSLGVDFSKVSFEGNLTGKATAGVSSEITNKANLSKMSNEKFYIDLGMGVSVDSNGDIDPQKAFNLSIPGINFMGFGKSTDGNSKNIYNLIGDIAKSLRADNYSYDDSSKKISGLRESVNGVLSSITEIGVRSKFLETTKNTLEDQAINLETRYQDVVSISPEKAIMDFKMQEFVYHAVLQMGTKIIQPTFLDYMS